MKPFKIVRWPRNVILFMMCLYAFGFIAILVYMSMTHGNGELFTKFRNVSPLLVIGPLVGISFLMSLYSIMRNLIIVRRIRRESMKV